MIKYEHFNYMSRNGAKEIFKKKFLEMGYYLPFKKSFMCEQLNVIFDYKKSECEITFFEHNGKLHTNKYPFPINEDHLIKIIIKTTPDIYRGIIKNQLKPKWRISALIN